jgi:hypothetical protein
MAASWLQSCLNPVAAMLATEKTRPHWFRSFIRGLWGSFEGAAYKEWDSAIHVVDPFQIPYDWSERLSSLDHGAANPTAAHAWVVDYDGNLVCFDELYQPGLVSAHAAELKRRRPFWLGAEDRDGYCFADPSIRAGHGLTSRRGIPASVLTEYLEFGVDWFVMANNDRAVGYARLLELVHTEPGRPFPNWHPKSGQTGAPRLYVFKTCENLIAQMQSAPVAKDGHDAGEAVDAKWDGAHGHAHASARYGVLSRPAPSPMPAQLDPLAPVDWEQRRAEMQAALWAKYDAQVELDSRHSSRLVDV